MKTVQSKSSTQKRKTLHSPSIVKIKLHSHTFYGGLKTTILKLEISLQLQTHKDKYKIGTLTQENYYLQLKMIQEPLISNFTVWITTMMEPNLLQLAASPLSEFTTKSKDKRLANSKNPMLLTTVTPTESIVPNSTEIPKIRTLSTLVDGIKLSSHGT